MNLIQRKLLQITPKEAGEFLELNTFQSQRHVRPAHVQRLVDEISNHTFLTGSIGIAKMTYNGNEEVMVNGQHQCLAVLATKAHITAVVEEYSVTSPLELSALYRSFDNHAARSLTDLTIPEAMALGITWPHRVISLVVTGAAIKEGKITAAKGAKIELLKKYQRHGDFIASILDPDTSHKHLRRAPVVCAMFLTWEKAKEDATDFWLDVRDGENLKRAMPTYKLREYLMTHSIAAGRGATASSNPVTNHEMICKCITAWNAFRKNEPTRLTYFPEKPVPRAI